MAETIANASTKRVAVVTGGNKGIGFEICKQLASIGITVVLTARDENKGNEALEKLKKSYGFGDDDLFFHKVDVLDSISINCLADFVKSKFGKLDILVNNAGISGAIFDFEALRAADLGNKPEGTEFDWSKIVMADPYDLAVECLKTNYYGPKRITEALIPLLELSGSPRVVSVSATAGLLNGIPNKWAKGVFSDAENLTEEKIDEVLNKFQKDFEDGLLKSKGWPTHIPAYTMSKAALNAYTRLAAKKNPSFCINCVCPGYVKTDLNSNNGILSIEEGAASPVRLALLPNGGPSGLFYNRDQISSF